MKWLKILILIEVIERLYEMVQTKLLVNLARHVKPEEITVTVQQRVSDLSYMQEKFGEWAAVQQESMRIITEGTQAAPFTLERIIRQVLNEDFKGIEFPKEPVNPGVLESQIREVLLQAKDAFNLTNTTMLESTMGVYSTAVNAVQDALNRAAIEVATGTKSTVNANKTAVDTLSKAGITGFTDRGGHHWSPEAYVSMVTRTTVQNARREGTWAKMEEYNEHVFQVSSHAGARPLCAPYQGRFYSNNGTWGTVYDSSGNAYDYAPYDAPGVTSYGEPAGLFGINCGHFPVPFFDGLSRAHYKPIETAEEMAENERRYAEYQTMRQYERRIRKWKEKEQIAMAGGDPDAADAAQQRARVAARQYRAYCDEHDLAPRNDRLWIGDRNGLQS